MSERITLPCGQIGIQEDCGYRCLGCLAIYGSIGCSCSTELERIEQSLKAKLAALQAKRDMEKYKP